MVIVAASFITASGLSCSPQGNSSPKESIRLGGMVSDAGNLIYVAQDQQYFIANGVDLTYRTYDSGPEAMSAMLNNEIDFAFSAEYPFVLRLLKNGISVLSRV